MTDDEANRWGNSTFGEPEPEDAKYERCYLRRVILSVLAGIFIAACVVGLQGCAATETFTGICALKPIGQDERGLAYFYTYCEAK